MTDKEQIIHLYKEMYAAMVNKDRAVSYTHLTLPTIYSV